MDTRLYSLSTPCPDGFSLCSEFHSRDFRGAPFALYAPSFDEAGDFLGAQLMKMTGLIIVSGERLSFAEITPLLTKVTVPPALFPDLSEFARHQIRLISLIVSGEDRVSFLALENERLTLSNQQASEEFIQFRAGLLREIEERRAAEQHLAESELKFRTLFTTLQDAIFLTDGDGNIIECNDKLSGYSRDELVGRSTTELGLWAKPEDRQHVVDVVAARGYINDFATTFRKKDGTVLNGSISTNMVSLNNGEFLLSVIRDIAERKQAEEERLRLEQQLLHAQKLESLGVLAGGIAHDFNNILTSIIGNADLALMRITPESPIEGNLKRIEQAAVRAAELAKQMLAYSGKGKFVVANIDINRLLEEILHMLEISISKKALLQLNLAPSLPAVEADATQIRQIIMNLVINASEAIGDNSGVIAISTGYQECDATYLKDAWPDKKIREGLYVYLEIADTGCGMDKETMTKIFDPFFTTKFTGRGLGMAAVLGIVRGHNGAIKVSSKPNKGTSFKILLPASSGRPVVSCDRDNHKNEWKGSGTVLLVDDEETVRDIGREILDELGFTTITANNGLEAIAVYRERPNIDFVILDLTMPHMDGEQCFHELRRIAPDVKVILSSGYDEQEVSQKFFGKGLAGFVQKPYKISVLKDAVRNMGSP